MSIRNKNRFNIYENSRNFEAYKDYDQLFDHESKVFQILWPSALNVVCRPFLIQLTYNLKTIIPQPLPNLLQTRLVWQFYLLDTTSETLLNQPGRNILMFEKKTLWYVKKVLQKKTDLPCVRLNIQSKFWIIDTAFVLKYQTFLQRFYLLLLSNFRSFKLWLKAADRISLKPAFHAKNALCLYLWR